jgi:hypothetical protein
MTSARPALIAALATTALLPASASAQDPPVDWYTDTGGGGVLAQPVDLARDGGAVAPVEVGAPIGDPPAPEPQRPPAATPAAAQPASGTEALAPRRSAPPRATAAQADDAPAAQAPDAPAPAATAVDPASDGALPFTGLGLAALVAAGLWLLGLGALLRPRRTA